MFNILKNKKFVGRTDDLLPSIPDRRDYLLSNFIPQIKRYPESMPRLFDLDILNQKTEPSCVGFSLAGIKQFNELKESTYKIFDGSFIYKEAKKIDGIPNIQGTYLKSGLDVLRNVGAKTGDEDPSIYKIMAYAKVDDNTFEGIKKAITLYGTVLCGFRGSNQGWASEVIRPPKSNETVWGHATFLCGYERDYLIGQNSWGIEAHNQGIFKTPKTYLPFESWIILIDKINQIEIKKKTGWVAKTFLTYSNKTTTNLNVREKPTISAKILKVLPKGTQVELYGSANVPADNHWWAEIQL